MDEVHVDSVLQAILKYIMHICYSIAISNEDQMLEQFLVTV